MNKAIIFMLSAGALLAQPRVDLRTQVKGMLQPSNGGFGALPGDSSKAFCGDGTWSSTKCTNGTGGSATWGGIGGLISSQTDLFNALALKAPLASPIFTSQPTIPDFTLSPHTHANTANGGKISAAGINGVIPIANLATGTPDGTKFVRDDGTLVTPSGGGGGTPAGPLKSIQFNNSSFGGDSNVSYVPTVATPAAPVVTNQGAAGSTSYGYSVVCRNGIGTTLPSPTTTTATGAGTLTGSNFNRIQTVVATGCLTYDIRRESSGGSPSTTGKISAGITPGAFTDDTGLPLFDSSPAPSVNTTVGLLSVNGFTQGTSAAIFGSNFGAANYSNPNGVSVDLTNGQFKCSGTVIPCVILNSTGSNFGQIVNIDATSWGLAFGSAANVNGTSALTWNDSQRVTIPGSLAVGSSSGALKMTSGVIGVVPGAGSNCVFADGTTGSCSTSTNATTLQGRAFAATAPTDTQTICWDAGGTTWKPCTGGGGGGASSIPQLTDLQTAYTSTTVLTIGAGACKVGVNTSTNLSSATVTISAGTATARIACDMSVFPPIIRVHKDTLTAVCSGCTADTAATFGADDSPLYTWTASAGTWDVSGGINFRGISGGYRSVAGFGITKSINNGTVTDAVDLSAIAERYVTAADPGCAAPNLGRIWVDTTSSVTTHFKMCGNVSSSPLWVTVF